MSGVKASTIKSANQKMLMDKNADTVIVRADFYVWADKLIFHFHHNFLFLFDQKYTKPITY